MRILTLYQHRESIIHRIDPISKIVYIITAILIPIIVPNSWVSLAVMLMSVLLLIIGKVFRKVIPLVSFSFILLLSIIVIQGLFGAGNKTEFIHLGRVVFYKEGLIYALKLCIRVINILCAFSILILTTKTSDLIEALVRRGMSSRIGYVLNSVLQIIPQMMATMDTISDAQRSRGMETEGKLITRARAFIPLIGPVVMNSLISTRERAMALEVRGFDSKNKKTFLNEQYDYKYSKAVQGILVLMILLSIAWRIFEWQR